MQHSPTQVLPVRFHRPRQYGIPCCLARRQPVTWLSGRNEKRELTSERLRRLYLDRLDHFHSKLRCVVTLTRNLALAQAQQADRKTAAGHYRGPLRGIPWGAKDLLDTAGIPTTYEAKPYRNCVPDRMPWP